LNVIFEQIIDGDDDEMKCYLPLLAFNQLPANENSAISGHWTSRPATHIFWFWVSLFYECSSNYLELIVCYYQDC